MSFLGGVFGAPTIALGVDSFGQSGTIGDLYGAHDLTTGSTMHRCALLALS